LQADGSVPDSLLSEDEGPAMVEVKHQIEGLVGEVQLRECGFVNLEVTEPAE